MNHVFYQVSKPLKADANDALSSMFNILRGHHRTPPSLMNSIAMAMATRCYDSDQRF